ncbi:protein nlg c; protein nlg b; protein nlg a [Trichuris trichiura]|uniref:Protein nlg c protein nlg b protein nlg a n=1 Tax=Trichuris trichiura TaxID=36087 RepID=A0A077YYY9_TRITR|nr:protein nlg c; protein nlg b; protein nlg a [Trichuris trichiura]
MNRGAAYLILLFQLLLLDAPADGSEGDIKIVQTSFGKLRGRVVHFRHLGLPSVEQYLGVPYGTAPTGSKRFMMPQTAAKWTNVIKDATDMPPACVQLWPRSIMQKSRSEALKVVNERIHGQVKRLVAMLRDQREDCLYMNLFVPARRGKYRTIVDLFFAFPKLNFLKKPQTELMPVLVIIHGDSYNWNSGTLYDGSILAAYGKLIVVTLNYRLGVFGFLSSGDPTCKGNWALSDIVCALDVLRAMVSDFGGDPTMVTLLGWDTGAALVNLLMSSPISAPVDSRLFRRAILLGGSALSSWALVTSPSEYFYQLADGLGCQIYKQNHFGQQTLLAVEDVLECIQTDSVENITRAAALLDLPTFLTNFGPVIDGIVVNTDPAYNLENHGSLFQEIDLLVGATKHEAYDQLSTEHLQYGLDVKNRDAIYRTFVRNMYSFHRTEIFNAIVNEYNDWYNPGQHPITVRDSVLEAISDALYLAPLTKVVRLHAQGKTPGGVHRTEDGTQRGKTFFYLFSHETSGNPRYGLKGSIHAEDLPYILGYPLLNNQPPSIELNAFDFTFNKQERVISEVLMRYIANFVKSGQELTGYIEAASRDYPKVDSFYRAHEIAFWNNFLPSLESTGRTESNPEHHLLPQHFLKNSYFGVVRPYDVGKMPFPPPPLPPTPIPTELTTILQNQQPAQVKITPQKEASSGSQSSQETATNYSTILSVTIAVGCALLILNLLVFAGIYRQRERHRKGKPQENSAGLLLQETSPYDMTATYGGLIPSGSGQYSGSGMTLPPASPVTTSVRDGEAYPYMQLQQRSSVANAYAGSGSQQMIVPPEEDATFGIAMHQQPQAISPVCPRHGKLAAAAASQAPKTQLEEIQV